MYLHDRLISYYSFSFFFSFSFEFVSFFFFLFCFCFTRQSTGGGGHGPLVAPPPLSYASGKDVTKLLFVIDISTVITGVILVLLYFNNS